jgi:hypothetical protein
MPVAEALEDRCRFLNPCFAATQHAQLNSWRRGDGFGASTALQTGGDKFKTMMSTPDTSPPTSRTEIEVR